MARNLATQMVDVKPDETTCLEAYLSCRLIPLDKNPGVRPIGIGEVLRWIIGKAIIFTIKPHIIDSAGDLQLGAGQPAGCEAAVHAMSEDFCGGREALFIWSRVPETTLPLETTLRSVYMEL